MAWHGHLLLELIAASQRVLVQIYAVATNTLTLTRR